MSLETQTESIPAGKTHEFRFSRAISKYLVGIGHFSFVFAEENNPKKKRKGHELQKVSLSLGKNQPDQQTVEVTVNAVMEDGSGHALDSDTAHCDVAVVAWCGDSSTVTVGDAPGIRNGEYSPLIPIPRGSAIDVSQAVLTGFSVEYDTHHALQAIEAIASSNRMDDGATIGSVVYMNNKSGDRATNATIDGAYLCGYNSPKFEIVPWQGADSTSVHFAQKVKAAVSLLTGFSISYPSGTDHNVVEIEAGIPVLELSADGCTATISSVTKTVDASEHIAVGTVSVAVVGIYGDDDD